MNPIFLIQQINAIKQNPAQLGQMLRSRGIINDAQMKDITQMGSNYEQVGQYLMNGGMMPQPPQSVVDQAINIKSA